MIAVVETYPIPSSHLLPPQGYHFPLNQVLISRWLRARLHPQHSLLSRSRLDTSSDITVVRNVNLQKWAGIGNYACSSRIGFIIDLECDPSDEGRFGLFAGDAAGGGVSVAATHCGFCGSACGGGGAEWGA